MTRVGLKEHIAKSEAQYIEIGLKLAVEWDGLEKLRTEMRTRMLASPLCDGIKFAGIMGKTLRMLSEGQCEDHKEQASAQNR